MKTKTINEKNNPVLKRKEITVEIIHEKGGTPDRITVRDFLASQLKENPENLYIINLDGKTGSDSSVCQAEIYENKELAEKILPQYLITRNLPPDKREVKQKAKVKPEETKKEKPEKTTISEKAKAKK